MSKKLFHVIIAIVAVIIFAQCSKKAPENPKPLSYDTRLKSFSFNQKNNPQLSENLSGIIHSDVVYITVPYGVNINSLVPTINVQDGLEIYINNNKIENSVSKIDFSNTIDLTIKSPDGSKQKGYYVLVKNGNRVIDRKVYDVMLEYDIPGISISATKNEKLVYSSGYGFADISTRERVTPKHLFRIASMSKSQTAMCIMKLYEEGKLSLDQTIFGEGGILEEEFGTSMPNRAKSVTIKNFLEHNSGWTSDPVDPCFTGNGTYYGKSLKERIAYVVNNVTQSYNPGIKYSYYNLGYGVLGMIIEKLSGKEYEKYLKEEIHAQAGVKDIHVGGDLSHRRKNEVIYYSQSGTNGYGNDMQVIKALGGIIASTDELMTLMSCVDYGTVVPDILKPSTLDIMYTPSKSYEHYGLGWRLNHSVFTDWASYHSGNLAGTASLWVRGDNGVNAVILCNSRSYESGYDTALYEIIEKVINTL
jgi:Beta-lactamase class C and other penicillin binding proteins